MQKSTLPVAREPDQKPWQRFFFNAAQVTYDAVVVGCSSALTLAVLVQPAYATGTTPTIWTKANEIMKDVYSQVLVLSTITAIVTASVALLLMNFSRNGKTVEESRAWLKRICISWVILNSLGFIMAYVTPFFSGGQWSG